MDFKKVSLLLKFPSDRRKIHLLRSKQFDVGKFPVPCLSDRCLAQTSTLRSKLISENILWSLSVTELNAE